MPESNERVAQHFVVVVWLEVSDEEFQWRGYSENVSTRVRVYFHQDTGLMPVTESIKQHIHNMLVSSKLRRNASGMSHSSCICVSHEAIAMLSLDPEKAYRLSLKRGCYVSLL